jgi:hypothetical protein
MMRSAASAVVSEAAKSDNLLQSEQAAGRRAAKTAAGALLRADDGSQRRETIRRDSMQWQAKRSTPNANVHKEQHGMLAGPLDEVRAQQHAVAAPRRSAGCERVYYSARHHGGGPAVGEQLHHQRNLPHKAINTLLRLLLALEAQLRGRT